MSEQKKPRTEEQLRRAMRQHRGGYGRCCRAREAGEREVQEANRPAYTNFKRAYRERLAQRKAGEGA